METTRQYNLSGRHIAARFGGIRKLVLAALIIIALAIAGYFVLGGKTPEEKAAQELASAVAAVGGLMILPEGDEPVLATVTDAEALIAQQAFFAGSVNGDQLLLYPKNLKAIIYSPSRGIIVNVGPIQQDATAPIPAGSIQGAPASAKGSGEARPVSAVAPTATELSVEVRNGTGKSGLAAEVAESIDADPRYKVIAVSDAKSNEYTKTVVYVKDGTGKKATLINEFVSLIGAVVASEMPAGEKDTAADFLIILGSQE